MTRALVVCTCAALGLAAAIAVTGGFSFTVGPIAVGLHRWPVAVLVGLLAMAAACRDGRAGFERATGWFEDGLDRHARAIAYAAAATAAGIGLAFGTYAASGSDASGYVSQAALLASGRVAIEEPLAREPGWPVGAWAFSPLGYRPGVRPGEIVPTYPPGLPLVMAVADRVVGADGPFLVSPLLGALAVLCAYRLGRLIESRTAGAIAAWLLATSPILLLQIVQPMSDVPVTGWWALAAVVALGASPLAPPLAGAVAGLALLTRPNLLPLAVVLAAVVAYRHGPRRLVWLVAGAAPAAALLLLLQKRLYGSAVASGYGPTGDLFAAANIWPNLTGYAGRLFVGEPVPLLLLAAAFLGQLLLRPDRNAPVTGRTDVGLAWLPVAWCVVTLFGYLPYGVFTEWSYLRFLLPAFPLASAGVAAAVARTAARVPFRAGGIVVVVAVTLGCCVDLRIARREQVFNIAAYDARHRTAGRYLETMLPADAVILAVQQSGSARFYTNRPVVRWDLVGDDLDAALDRLVRARRHPFLLVEDWEAPDLRRRFPSSEVARLDWPARFDLPGTVTVRLYDPFDRFAPAGPAARDRFR